MPTTAMRYAVGGAAFASGGLASTRAAAAIDATLSFSF